ncbi:hypothetical protein PHMEG_0001692 [Phytophthora megakarya]|uniref:HTH myb-type domain-containing protein n=1 Tax=Phytophthora megakarya TaxID=4795 RepID=A0A225X0K4_9STRA|nr:hypothetical protein PHMEG_0001692 [Phytophthora megakarya]
MPDELPRKSNAYLVHQRPHRLKIAERGAQMNMNDFLFPYGSWKRIAAHVGTRAVQQVMSHAQSVRAKKKRIQERENRRTTESTALRNSAKSHSPKNQNARTSTRQMPTPEELLLASMRTPLPAHANPLQTRPVAVIESDYADVASVNIDPNQLEISGVSNYAVGHPVPPVEKDAAKSGDGDFHRVLQAQKCRLCPDLTLDSDIPLLNDDGIAGLIDILPNQNQTPM